MKHIAVMIRGHLRTWNYTKNVMFDFYDSIADSVDYYFATWEMYSTHTMAGVVNDFAGRNLVKLITVPPTVINYTSWIGPGLFSSLLVPYKKQREKYVKYDAVFDTRPDVIHQLLGDNIIDPEPNSLYTTYFNNQRENTPEIKFHIGMADHFFMMTSEVYDIISQRYILRAEHGPHIELQRICESESINPCSIGWVNAFISRPNHLDELIDPYRFILAMARDWRCLSSSEKRECLVRHNIDFADYMTGSITCAL
jgi:hypothetical protein